MGTQHIDQPMLLEGSDGGVPQRHRGLIGDQLVSEQKARPPQSTGNLGHDERGRTPTRDQHRRLDADHKIPARLRNWPGG